MRRGKVSGRASSDVSKRKMQRKVNSVLGETAAAAKKRPARSLLLSRESLV